MKKTKVTEYTEPQCICQECGDEVCECDNEECKGEEGFERVNLEEDEKIIYCMGNHEHFCKACGEEVKKKKRRKK